MNDVLDSSVRRRRLRLLVSGVFALAAMIAMITYWMYPTHEYTRAFDIPKIVTAHLDDEPFARVTLAPGESYRPIDVMAATDPKLLCEVVSRTGSPRFMVKAFGATLESRDCEFRLSVPDAIGTVGTVEIRFFDGETGSPTDVMEIPVAVIPAGSRIEFQGLEDEHRKPVQGVSVPDRVMVYARAATSLPDHGPFDSPGARQVISRFDRMMSLLGACGVNVRRLSADRERDMGAVRDFVALFFIADAVTGVPVLQIAPFSEDDKEPRPLAGQILRYRRYGSKLDGFAFWTPQPISLAVQNSPRGVTDVYVGLFPRSALDDVVRKTIDVKRTSVDTVSITPLVKDVEALRAMTFEDRNFSPPLHLVRGGTRVEIGGQ